MKYLVPIAIMGMLSACAESDATPEERAAAYQAVFGGRSAPAPYQAPVNSNMMGLQPPGTQTQVNCTSNGVGQSIYTNCR